MAVKTITIDLEAYSLLAHHKTPGDSFSDVIKAHFKKRATAKSLREFVRTVRLSDSTLDAMRGEVRARRRNPARLIKL